MENTEIEKLFKYACDYRKDAKLSIEYNREKYAIDEGEFLKERHIDAVLADFLNFIIEKETSFMGCICSHEMNQK